MIVSNDLFVILRSFISCFGLAVNPCIRLCYPVYTNRFGLVVISYYRRINLGINKTKPNTKLNTNISQYHGT
jgi:hypothetical protein